MILKNLTPNCQNTLKMKKTITFLAIIFLCSCLHSPFESYGGKCLTIHNYSDEAIYVYHSYFDSIQLVPKLELFTFWPDRAPDEKDLDPYCSPEYRVNAHDLSYITDGHHTETQWIPFPDHPEINYVNFFFIKESTMKKYKWEEIVAKQMYVKKIRNTYGELEKMNYEISYKP